MKITETQAIAYSSEEAAERLGMSRNTLQVKYKKLGIPHVKVGRTLLFPIGKFECWKLAHEKEAKRCGKPD